MAFAPLYRATRDRQWFGAYQNTRADRTFNASDMSGNSMSYPGYPERYGNGPYFLRRLTPDRVTERYLCWMNDPTTVRYLQARFQKWDLEALRSFVTNFDHVNGFIFGIHDAEHDLHVGNVILRCNPHHHFGTIGFLVGDREHQGRSAARTAIATALDFAFLERRLRKVIGTTTENHSVSNHLFRSMGFCSIGTIPDLYWSEGAYRAETWYGIDVQDWARQHGHTATPVPVPECD